MDDIFGYRGTKTSKYGSFSPTIFLFFFGQNPFSAILRLKRRKKVPMATKLEVMPLKKNFFCGFPEHKTLKNAALNVI